MSNRPKKAEEDQLQLTVRNTLRKLSRPTNKNCLTADRRLEKCVLTYIKKCYTEDRGRAGVLEEDEEQAEEGTMETTKEDKKVGGARVKTGG
ncbi:hypothetical protein DPX16_15528 [Anabarilius grahami]|uniref:Uncharacterized protein n=1 Tax=Anabarilius grahami TaxID=495550 RepID=A0A3N0XCF5_ANAGA|nr:hypothetical protein DPX16_15528 [Anabarilius grahami]